MRLPHQHHNSSEQIAAFMPDAESFGTVSSFFRQLGDPNRIRILWLLCHTEECVVNIAAIIGMSSPAAMHHLKLLKEAGLIESRRNGKEVYYRVSETEEAAALHFMIEEMMKISCPEVENDEIHAAIKAHSHQHDECGSCDSANCIHKLPHIPEMPSEAEKESVFMERSVTPDNAALISSIHDFITKDLRTHYTTEDLSKIFHINTTTLKKAFSSTYGQPIAAYMKEMRMRAAEEYLRETSLEIGEIADALGYANHAKFSAAFKEYSGMLPKAYRKSKI